MAPKTEPKPARPGKATPNITQRPPPPVEPPKAAAIAVPPATLLPGTLPADSATQPADAGATPANAGNGSGGPTPSSGSNGGGHVGPKRSGYRTNYYIEIQGDFRPYGGNLLIINNTTRVPLKLIHFILLYFLACVARTQAGLPAPRAIESGDYLSPQAIEELILAEKAARPSLNGSLKVVTPCVIHNAKWEIRKRIRIKHKNPELIEALDGLGYRFSNPPARIRIKIIGPSRVWIWDWTE